MESIDHRVYKLDATTEESSIKWVYTVVFSDTEYGALWQRDFSTREQANKFHHSFKDKLKIVRIKNRVMVKCTDSKADLRNPQVVIDQTYDSNTKAKLAAKNLKVMLPTSRFIASIEAHVDM